MTHQGGNDVDKLVEGVGGRDGRADALHFLSDFVVVVVDVFDVVDVLVVGD